MAQDFDNELLIQGQIHLRAGERSLARRYLERALNLADDWDTRLKANFLLSQLSEDPQERRHYLENTLAIEPTHAEARRALAILDGKLKPEEIIDPNAPLPAPVATRTAHADRFTCPQCGGRMHFNPDGRTLSCEFCARDQALRAQAAPEQDFFLAMATRKGHGTPRSQQAFHCAGCGADFLLPPAQKTVTCAYCGSAHIVLAPAREWMEPDALLPFNFGREQAEQKLAQWAREQKIRPQQQVARPQAFYLPVWTFDISGTFPWKGQVYRQKHWEEKSGQEIIHYTDIPISAGRSLPGKISSLLEECNFSQAQAYDPRFLAGWPAAWHEISLAQASLDAREVAVRRAKAEALRRWPQIHDFSYSTANLSTFAFQLVLIGVWRMVYRMDDQEYNVYLNGSDARLHAEKPASGLLGLVENLLT